MKKLFTVGEISKMFGISRDTVRLYDKRGILSPAKSNINNYRYYTREDLIFFYHIGTLKKFGLPLNMIKMLLYEGNLNSCAKTISLQKQVIENKIIELIRLKQMLSDYENTLNEAVNNLNIIKICESPAIIYKIIDLDDEKSIINAIDSFNKLTNKKVPSFTFILDKEYILKDKSDMTKTELLSHVKNAVSLKDEWGLLENPFIEQGKFQVIKPQVCISSFVKSGMIDHYQSLSEMERYIKEHNLKIAGDYFVRALSFSRYNDISCDYYEILTSISY